MPGDYTMRAVRRAPIPASPWTAELAGLRDELGRDAGVAFNALLMNQLLDWS